MFQRLWSSISQVARRSYTCSRSGAIRVAVSKRGAALYLRHKIVSRPTAILRPKLGSDFARFQHFCTQDAFNRPVQSQRTEEKIQGFLQITPKISLEIDRQLDKIHAAITKSKDANLQQKIIHPTVQNPMPLSTEANGWSTYYFDDMKSTKLYTSLSSLVERNSLLTDQDNFLIAMVQYSGVGKTHLGLTYCRHDGCLPILFTRQCHLDLLTMADNFITSLYPSPETWKNKGVLSFEEEKQFMEQSKQAVQLIPMTFIQFAGIYLQKVPPSKTDPKFDGLVRAMLDTGCISIIQTMYQENLRHYATLQTHDFNEIFGTSVAIAKNLGIKAIIYDEVANCQNFLRGKFMHYSNQTPQGERIAQLVAEHENTEYRKNSSLLYLLRIAMEEFSRAKIGQIMATTDYSSTLQCLVGNYSREQLQTLYLPFQEDSTKRLARFKDLLNHAFGCRLAEEMKKTEVENKLSKLASRAVYLFKELQGINLGSYPANLSAKEFMNEYLKSAEESAKKRAQKYITNAGNYPYYKGALLHAMVQICLSAADSLELEPWAIAQCVKHGLVHLPAGFNVEKLGTIPTSTDPYIREYLQTFTVEQIIKKFLACHQHWPNGTLGQYLTTLMMLKGSESPNARISQLFSTGSFKLDNTQAAKFSLQPARTVATALAFDNKEDYSIMALSKQPNSKFLQSIYIPSNAFRPDGVVPLVDAGRPAGFLVYQCKHHSTALSWQYFVTEALDSVQPLCFYSGASSKYMQWVQTYNEISDATPLVWIRAVYARGFSEEVWQKVKSYNETSEGEAAPIILMTPESMFPKVQHYSQLQSVNVMPKEITTVTLTAEEVFALSLQTPGATVEESQAKRMELARTLSVLFPKQENKSQDAESKKANSKKTDRKKATNVQKEKKSKKVRKVR